MRLKITIDNRVYEVEVEAFEPEPTVFSGRFQAAAAGPPPAPAPAVSQGAGRSPVAGVVVKVLAGAGDQVEKGQTVVVLEAMKMETNITAARPGVLKSVLVEVGAAVVSGQPLFEFEDEGPKVG